MIFDKKIESGELEWWRNGGMEGGTVFYPFWRCELEWWRNGGMEGNEHASRWFPVYFRLFQLIPA
jgi:hypothetical protein